MASSNSRRYFFFNAASRESASNEIELTRSSDIFKFVEGSDDELEADVSSARTGAEAA